MADLGAQVDVLLTKYEKELAKLEKAQGSAVKLQNAEINLLSVIKEVRDVLTTAMSNKSDKDRSGLLEVYGGDCARIAKFRQLIGSTTLSEKNSADPRFTQSLTSLETIETIIREKGQGAALAAAQDKAKSAIQGSTVVVEPGAAEAAAAAEKLRFEQMEFQRVEAEKKAKEEEEEKKQITLEVERKQKEWEKQQEEEAKERQRKKKAEEEAAAKAEEEAAAKAAEEASRTVVTSEGQDFAKVVDEAKRDIMVELGCEVQPVFDWGDGDEFTLVVPMIKAKIKLIVTPPLPESDLKKYAEEQTVEIEVPEIKKVIFDPNTKTPADGILQVKVNRKIMILEIPGNIEAKVGSRAMQPWGAKKLKEGEDVTELHYEVQIDEKFALVAGKGSSELSVDLDLTFDCKLTGAGSAKFTVDGQVRPTPVKK